MSDTLDTEEDEAEADGLVSQVLDELGIEMGAKLDSAPIGKSEATPKREEKKAVADAVGASSSAGGLLFFDYYYLFIIIIIIIYYS